MEGVGGRLSTKGGGDMTIREKIDVAAVATEQQIHLWKEGIFWVAYEQSAYLVWLLKKYKPTKKFIKSVGMEVVSIGFPATALASVMELITTSVTQSSVGAYRIHPVR